MRFALAFTLLSLRDIPEHAGGAANLAVVVGQQRNPVLTGNPSFVLRPYIVLERDGLPRMLPVQLLDFRR